MEFEWMEALLEDSADFLSGLFEQGFTSAGSRLEESEMLGRRFSEAGLSAGSGQFKILSEELQKSKLEKNWDVSRAAEAYCVLWNYVKSCGQGLELARAEAALEAEEL